MRVFVVLVFGYVKEQARTSSRTNKNLKPMPNGRDISVYSIVEQDTSTRDESSFYDAEVLLEAMEIGGIICIIII